VQNAYLKLHDAGVKDILATDTLEKAISKVSVAPVIANAIRK
jgi:ribose-phosphate pyrophosphokinase